MAADRSSGILSDVGSSVARQTVVLPRESGYPVRRGIFDFKQRFESPRPACGERSDCAAIRVRGTIRACECVESPPHPDPLPASGAREKTQHHTPAAQIASGWLGNHSPFEGVGNAGCSLHPQPRVRNNKSTRASSPQVHRFHPAFPHAMVLTAYYVLSPATGLFCHRRLADHPQNLTPASGRQDHTSLPSASASLVSRHRASTASRTNVRDDRETPLYRDGTGKLWI
jgi:hypothetical protein